MKDPHHYHHIVEPVDHLKTDEDIFNYLEAALDTDDPELISAVLGDIARARLMASAGLAIV